MNATDTRIPATFEQYAELNNVPADHGNLDGWRKVYEHEVFAEAHAPATIPPCPWWCADQAGHGYDSTDGTGDELAFERFHHAPVGPLLTVDAPERNHYGTVSVTVPSVYLDERADVDAAGARALAADLLAAADLLERIEAAQAKMTPMGTTDPGTVAAFHEAAG